MRPQPITIATLLAVVTLSGAIVATAITGASGAPARSVLVTRMPAVPIAVSAPSCALDLRRAASAIRMGGVCRGRLTGAFTCLERAGLLALSIDSPFGRRGQAFHLTIVVSGSPGSGRYSEAAAVAQITGLGNVSRWSNPMLEFRVGPDGSVIELGRSVLAAEPGTPATGALTIGGRAACAP